MKISLLFLVAILSRDTSGWLTCGEQEFCSSIRESTERPVFFLDDVITNQRNIEADIVKEDGDDERFQFKLTALDGDTLRLTIQDPENPRYTPSDDVLDGDPVEANLNLAIRNEDMIGFTTGNIAVTLSLNPFSIEVRRGGVPILIVNQANGLVFNRNGSLALDFAFPSASHLYGIPQHAERLSLPTTTSGEPFRLFNVDYYGYPAFTREAVYGAIGVLYGIGTSLTSGIFWMNAAQTFVDIEDGNKAFIIGESGALELFIFGGPTLKDTVKQFTKLTGTGELPQYYNLGYHQSRYSYMSQEDVETVVAEFDNHNFAMDTIWLDIDHTDGYRYFTWNSETFPDPIGMQNKVLATGRKMVAISDPHFKVDDEYFVYTEALTKDYLVKHPNGTVFEGQCWPGLSSYVDFFDPGAQNWYSDLYHYDNYVNSTRNLHIWNDMNEPSVFEVEEQTFPPDLKHYGGWEHRDVHNMYGFKQTQATKKGLLTRDPERRPFILTRAHFAGSQRYAALWTGDNQPTWEHLEISIPMILTESLGGIAFVGADVGGFTGAVAEDLLQRWYQAGAWYPFFRGHSGTDTPRREPYLYGEITQGRVREAIRTRYRHLPYWYRLFFEHERTGEPIARPLSYHYPDDPDVLDIDDQWLVGADILVAPVLEESATSITTYFPGGYDVLWYDLSNHQAFRGTGDYVIDVTMDSSLYYYRGGSIIFTIENNVRNTEDQRNLPYRVLVFLDENDEAEGKFYLDDWQSFDYKDNQYHYYRFRYSDGGLSVEKIDAEADFYGTLTIGQIDVYSASTADFRSDKVAAIVRKGDLSDIPSILRAS